MVKERIPETNEGIQNEADATVYLAFSRSMRDRGLMQTGSFLRAGISAGQVMEIGPGPGYEGLELLKKCPLASLTGLEISPAMIQTAYENAKEYGFEDRVRYVKGNSIQMPFADESFDGVISNGSLHEWESPGKVFSEIRRVLRPGGKFCVTDLRRDINPAARALMFAMTKPKEIRPGLNSSVNASYTLAEIQDILARAGLVHCRAARDFMGLTVSGEKR